MSPSPTDRFRIEAVFDALVDLSTDEQIAYLDRTASDDPELRPRGSSTTRSPSPREELPTASDPGTLCGRLAAVGQLVR